MKFVSLHSHSTHSYMDGFNLPFEHIKKAQELGMSAYALTEHGNVSSHVQLEKAGKKHGVRPIFGVEAYLAPLRTRAKFHLTVLAMDQQGYVNLNKLVSLSWKEFYQFPTISESMLMEYSSGLIVLSGCADSQLSCTLLGGKSLGEKREQIENLEEARALVLRYKEVFGERYYLECQQFPELQRTRALNPILAEFGKRFGIDLVATADVHFVNKADSEMRKILHAAGRGTGTVEAAEAGWEYNVESHIPISDASVGQRLIRTGLSKKEAWQAILNTSEIAERCNVVLPKAAPLAYPGNAEDMKSW